MAEPKKRMTSSRSGKRRAHIQYTPAKLALCPKCKQKLIPHRVCSNCGYYKGTDILNLEAKEKAKEERRKQREAEEESEAK